MGITIKCKKCGCTEGYLRFGDVHTGLHCSKCNSWIKWVSKAEVSILESGETVVDEFFEEVIDIEKLKKQRDDLDKQINDYYKKQTEQDIANNYGYIGKTFKRAIAEDTIGYYKILSVEEDNQYRMKTLVFVLPIDTLASNNMYEETSLLDIQSIGWFCNSMTNYNRHKREIDLYTEISNEEYLEAYDKWLKSVMRIVKHE